MVEFTEKHLIMLAEIHTTVKHIEGDIAEIKKKDETQNEKIGCLQIEQARAGAKAGGATGFLASVITIIIAKLLGIG